ncbi:DNA polymerase IV [Thalassotalea piscium]
MKPIRKIIHVDMDAFYVSVEIRDNPQLAGKPVAVGGKTNARGVLSTCNYLAREYGVRSAMPSSVALRKCPHLIIVPGRMEVYKSISTHLRSIFERYTDKIEPLSLDEAYLDVTHCRLFNGSATLIAEDIRKAIFSELNLTASAGIAPIKFLAKVASDLNKPNGQYVITPQEVSPFIEQMSLNKIPGVGKVTFEKLKAHGFEKGADIIAADERVLLSQFGKLGRSLWQKCHGIDNREVETTRIRKSVGVETTFPEDISSFEELKQVLSEKLLPELIRRSEKHLENRKMNKLGIKIKFSDFIQTTKELKHSIIDSKVLERLLEDALDRGDGKNVRLLGVSIGLGDDEQDTENQLTLF